jgi:hypothetical protein
MEDGMITFRKVEGQINYMPVCAKCDRNAMQARMTEFEQHERFAAPMLCDECQC